MGPPTSEGHLVSCFYSVVLLNWVLKHLPALAIYGKPSGDFMLRSRQNDSLGDSNFTKQNYAGLLN